MTPVEDFLARPFGVMTDAIRLHAASRPGHPALIHDDRVLDYGELDAMMNRVTGALQRDGCRKGDAIAI